MHAILLDGKVQPLLQYQHLSLALSNLLTLTPNNSLEQLSAP